MFKKILYRLKQYIAVIVSISLVMTSLPAHVSGTSKLASPGISELVLSAIGMDAVPVKSQIAVQKKGVLELEARSVEELEKILKSYETIKNLDKPIKLTFIMPMYNEERRLMPWSPDNQYGEDALRKKIKQLQDLHAVNPNFEWRLIIVDDGSPTEACYECAKDLWKEIQKEEKLPSDKVLIERITPERKKEINSRKGGAIFYGIQKALDIGWADYIGYTDVDMSIDVRLTGNLLDALVNDKADVAIGSRWCKGADRKGMPLQAYLSSIGFDWLVRKIIPPLRGIKDTQRGFKLFTRESLERIKDFAKDNGFAFDVELLLLSKLAGYTIQEVPISWFESQKASTLNLFSDAKNMFLSLFRFERHFKWRKVVTVFIWDEEKGILLTKRNPKKKFGGGKWEAGITETLKPDKAYPGDGYKKAAIRGLKEELHLEEVDPKNLIQIGNKNDYVYTHWFWRKKNTIGSFYFYKLPKGTKIKLEKHGEVIDITWQPIHAGLHDLLRSFKNDLRESKEIQTFFSPQLEHLNQNPEALKKVYALLGIDGITHAVEQIEVDIRLKDYEKIKPEIEKFLRRFIIAETEEGKKILSEQKNLKIDSKEHYYKKSKYIFFGIGLALAALTIKFGIYPLLAGRPSWKLILVTVIGLRYAAKLIYLGIEDHRRQNGDSCYYAPRSGKKSHILMKEDWDFDSLRHEFVHFISDDPVLNLDDRTHCLGCTFEFLLLNYKISDFAEGYIWEHVNDVYEMMTYPSVDKAKKYLIKELLKREDKYFRLNGKYEDDDYETGKWLALMIRILFPVDMWHQSQDKEAFKFIVELFRDMKIARRIEKIRFGKYIYSERKETIKNNIFMTLKQFIDPEKDDGRKILEHIERKKIFTHPHTAKIEKNNYYTFMTIEILIMVIFGFVAFLINMYAFASVLPALFVGYHYIKKYSNFYKQLCYIKNPENPNQQLLLLGNIISEAMDLRAKDRGSCFAEAFRCLSYSDVHGKGYQDGKKHGEILKHKSLFKAKRKLIEFIQKNNFPVKKDGKIIPNTYVGAYLAGAIRTLFPDDDKGAFEFLITLFKEVKLSPKNKPLIQPQSLNADGASGKRINKISDGNFKKSYRLAVFLVLLLARSAYGQDDTNQELINELMERVANTREVAYWLYGVLICVILPSVVAVVYFAGRWLKQKYTDKNSNELELANKKINEIYQKFASSAEAIESEASSKKKTYEIVDKDETGDLNIVRDRLKLNLTYRRFLKRNKKYPFNFGYTRARAAYYTSKALNILEKVLDIKFCRDSRGTKIKVSKEVKEYFSDKETYLEWEEVLKPWGKRKGYRTRVKLILKVIRASRRVYFKSLKSRTASKGNVSDTGKKNIQKSN